MVFNGFLNLSTCATGILLITFITIHCNMNFLIVTTSINIWNNGSKTLSDIRTKIGKALTIMIVKHSDSVIILFAIFFFLFTENSSVTSLNIGTASIQTNGFGNENFICFILQCDSYNLLTQRILTSRIFGDICFSRLHFYLFEEFLYYLLQTVE